MTIELPSGRNEKEQTALLNKLSVDPLTHSKTVCGYLPVFDKGKGPECIQAMLGKTIRVCAL